MAETPTVEVTGEGFPSPALPTFYCDGIANLAPSLHVVKFYLFRTDPDQMAKPKYKNQIIAQVVMPVTAFIYAGLMFEAALKQFVQQGAITQQAVDEMRQSLQRLQDQQRSP
jgi:hypothetical protein